MAFIFVCIFLLIAPQLILNADAATEYEESERSLDLFSHLNPLSIYTSKFNFHKRVSKIEKILENVKEEIGEQKSNLEIQRATLDQLSQWTKEEFKEIKEGLIENRDSVKAIRVEVTQMAESIRKLDQNYMEFVEETRMNFHLDRFALAESNGKVQELEMSTAELNQTRVPIGFVYLQLFGQPTPQQLWPDYIWKDDSTTYAGLFFRVEGRGSAPFGQIQDSSFPRIVQVESKQDEEYAAKTRDLEIGKWSAFLETGRGQSSSSSSGKTRFFTSDDEVTPKNQAIKIWTRVG